MQPQDTRVWRKDGRRPTRRASEPVYHSRGQRLTLRQAMQACLAEAEALRARHEHVTHLRHETVCMLYELARVQREVEAEMGWPLTPTDEIVAHLRTKLFGESE